MPFDLEFVKGDGTGFPVVLYEETPGHGGPGILTWQADLLDAEDIAWLSEEGYRLEVASPPADLLDAALSR